MRKKGCGPECESLLAHASELLDGELAPRLREKARRHLDACEDCAREVQGLKSLIDDCHKLKDGRPGKACREKFRAVFERWKCGKKPCKA